MYVRKPFDYTMVIYRCLDQNRPPPPEGRRGVCGREWGDGVVVRGDAG